MTIDTGGHEPLPMLELTPEAVHFDVGLQLACDDPHVDYVTRFRGTAVYDDPEAEEPVLLCEVDGQRVDVRAALAHKLDLETLFDSLSAELSDFYHAVFDKDGKLRCDHGSRYAGEICNIIYVAQLEVRPAARGMGIGSRMMRRLMRALDARDSLVALKAFPLSEDEYDGPALDHDAAVARVKRFYSRLGFEPVAEEFMVTDARYLAGRPAD